MPVAELTREVPTLESPRVRPVSYAQSGLAERASRSWPVQVP
jgi:hypothetical protein